MARRDHARAAGLSDPDGGHGQFGRELLERLGYDYDPDLARLREVSTDDLLATAFADRRFVMRLLGAHWALIVNGMNLLGVQTFWQNAVMGTIILISVFADQLGLAVRGHAGESDHRRIADDVGQVVIRRFRFPHRRVEDVRIGRRYVDADASAEEIEVAVGRAPVKGIYVETTVALGRHDVGAEDLDDPLEPPAGSLEVAWTPSHLSTTSALDLVSVCPDDSAVTLSL